MDSRHLLQAFTCLGNPVGRSLQLHMVWVQLGPQSSAGTGEKHLGLEAGLAVKKRLFPCSAGIVSPLLTLRAHPFSASHVTLSLAPMAWGKPLGEFLAVQQPKNWMMQCGSPKIHFALSALVYTGSRDIKYKFASGFVPLRLENWHFCWHSFLTFPKSLWNVSTRKSTAFGGITSSTSRAVNDSSVWQGLWHLTTVALPAEVF